MNSANGVNVQKSVEADKNPAQEMYWHPHPMEEVIVKETLPRQTIVIPNRVQLTANGDPTANGQTVLKIVEVEKKHEPEMRLHQHQTEGKNVSVIPRKQKLATKRIVLQVSLLLLYDHIAMYIKL